MFYNVENSVSLALLDNGFLKECLYTYDQLRYVLFGYYTKNWNILKYISDKNLFHSKNNIGIHYKECFDYRDIITTNSSYINIF